MTNKFYVYYEYRKMDQREITGFLTAPFNDAKAMIEFIIRIKDEYRTAAHFSYKVIYGVEMKI